MVGEHSLALHANGVVSEEIEASHGGLSAEAIRIIQSLQARLKRARRQLNEAESEAERAAATAEKSAALSGSHSARRRQTADGVESLRIQLDEEQERQQALEAQVRSADSELEAARSHRARLVSGDTHRVLQEQLQTSLREMEEASAEAASAQAQIAAAERKGRRHSVLLVERAQREAREAEEIRVARMSSAYHRAAAKRVSEKAVREQRHRHSTQLLERVATLRDRKERMEVDLQNISQRNAERECTLETLRERNRQLEVQERRLREAAALREHELRKELRSRAHQVKLLSSIGEPSEDLPPSSLLASTPSSYSVGAGVDCAAGCGGESLAADFVEPPPRPNFPTRGDGGAVAPAPAALDLPSVENIAAPGAGTRLTSPRALVRPPGGRAASLGGGHPVVAETACAGAGSQATVTAAPGRDEAPLRVGRGLCETARSGDEEVTLASAEDDLDDYGFGAPIGFLASWGFPVSGDVPHEPRIGPCYAAFTVSPAA